MIPVVDPASIAGEHYDIIVVGTGFGSAFFLLGLLADLGEKTRVLVVERGGVNDHAWQFSNGRNSPIPDDATYSSTSEKPWNFTIGFGGGTNCWFAQTPRMQPSDFRMQSLYGFGDDWPISYDDLERHYCRAEEAMAISGDPAMAQVLPRSMPFPQPPHNMSSVDRMMQAAQPDRHFVMPTARARVATDTRPACCASLRCQICPADAKFTALNSMRDMFSHPAITLVVNTRALRFEETNGTVRRLVVYHKERETSVSGDLFVLGANAIHSPAILQASDMDDRLTGKGLHEAFGAELEVYLDGLDNFDGSTITTGLNYSMADGPFRSSHSGALIYFENRWKYGLRREPGRWRQSLPIMLAVEDTLDDRNYVALGEDGEPVVHFHGISEYAKDGMQAAIDMLPKVLDPLPVERIRFHAYRSTESHLQGTLRMGSNPATSVVDASLIHHRYRNLVVVGSSTFATCSTANPSLTVAALSLRAASRLSGRSA
ncbi:GMC oxidoreductase [Antarcticirhabdus aurantiaca]|uniref:GMC family oxidoreductase n=1 Tax=Antarcticirhabdus aurantiaca TaxID=2606717 RepID=A0ACD4NJS1_9HYPH|nr:GMC family oxidoreductase [Antarcticirhabdus aurantiaca]WAJ27054.1 GMC family oxidoreductase [Jeongeuplla avenae]